MIIRVAKFHTTNIIFNKSNKIIGYADNIDNRNQLERVEAQDLQIKANIAAEKVYYPHRCKEQGEVPANPDDASSE